jgi:UPF0042 nucleotide-binding protein
MSNRISGKKKGGRAQKVSATKSKTQTKNAPRRAKNGQGELVIVTGLSGSGKLSALHALEDLGYYGVYNMPVELVSSFADMILEDEGFHSAAIVVDANESSRVDRFVDVLNLIRKRIPVRVMYIQASDDTLVRRFSESRRPHPSGGQRQVLNAIAEEKRMLEPLRNIADFIVDTTKLNVQALRAHVSQLLVREKKLLLTIESFGFKNGVPADADIMFDIRFLPNPQYRPELQKHTGRDSKVAAYVNKFPQTRKFMKQAEEMLTFLLPHYLAEGKSYLTVAIGCTGGQHRSVFVAEEMRKRMAKHGYNAKLLHRDIPTL